MTKHTIWKRVSATIVAVVMLMGALIPLTTIESQAKYVWVPSSMVTSHSIFKVAKGISVTVKGIGAIVYATENNQGGVGDWAKLAMAYFSGNADENQQIDDLKSTMIEQFQATQSSIEELRKDIAALRRDITAQIGELGNVVEYTYLRSALDQFYTEFFSSAYSDLEEAYLNIIEVLDDPHANDATVRAKMDDLYMKAYKMKNLQGYITGEIRFNNESILDLYYEYRMRVSNIQPSDAEGYQAILDECQEFTLKLFEADTFQKYCMAYASSYQLNYVYEHMDDMTAQGQFIGYTLDGTLDGSSNKLTIQEIKNNIKKIDEGTATVSSKVAANLSDVYLLNTYVGYTENKEQYFAPVKSNAVEVYPGATYQMFALPDEIEDIFGCGFSFVTSNANDADLHDTGSLTITGAPGATFTVSYVYGQGVLEQPLNVYSLTFKIVNRKWAGGYGNAEAPYLISTVAHLKDFTSDSSCWTNASHVKMIGDIDVSGQTITTISEFYGVFDGGDHTIQNWSGAMGLFGINRGEIKNLRFENLHLSSSTAGEIGVGGIANQNSGVITNCHLYKSKIDIYRHNYTGSSGYTSFAVVVGGIAAYGTSGSVIQHCSVVDSTLQGTISTRELYDSGNLFPQDDMTMYTTVRAGGIVGSTDNTTVKNNYVGGTTISTTTYARYYKWSFLWSHTYNRVNAKVYSGIIAGNQSGSFADNLYYDSSNSDNPIHKSAAEKSDGDFVSTSVNTGVQGVATESASAPAYLTEIHVDNLPYRTTYQIGDKINTTGLLVVDNFQNPIYGYSVDSVNTETDGAKSVNITYNGQMTTFSVDVGCKHKNIDFVPREVDAETSTIHTAGIFCNDCRTYTDGWDTIQHSDCTDEERDHVCDVCHESVGEHKTGTDPHVCEYCGELMTECVDENKDHACDACSEVMGEHLAVSEQHECDYCGKPVTSCEDVDQDHECDICGTTMGTHEISAGSHVCAYCGEILTECADEDRDHVCDVCGAAMGTHEAEAGRHTCVYCGQSVTSYNDGDRDHVCDICGIFTGKHTEKVGTHICSYCNVKVSDCSDSDKNHACDICGAETGNHESVAQDHTCAYCGEKIGSCQDTDKNHSCDVCGLPVGTHVAIEGTHRCSYCDEPVSSCMDMDRNHTCDTCATFMGEHVEVSGSHICAYCGNAVADCRDNDRDHACDVCFTFVGNHVAGINTHDCLYCGQMVTKCVDQELDHVCDVCDRQIGEHSAQADSHVCDYCGEALTLCSDADLNHLCDLCGVQMGNDAVTTDAASSTSDQPRTNGCAGMLGGTGICFYIMMTSAYFLFRKKKST